MAVFLPLVLLASSNSQIPDKLSINLHRALGSEFACIVGQRSVQFLSETELLLLAGPTSDCYRSVSQLSLVVISLEGRILARKPWPSTYPAVVISPNRITVATSNELEVLDSRLTTVQVLQIPKVERPLSIYLQTDGTGKVWFTLEDTTFIYGGVPLKYLAASQSPSRQSEGQQIEGELIHDFGDGRKLVKSGSSLLEIKEGTSRHLADLSWVVPCEKYCQQYEAGTAYQVVTANKPRIMVESNGSKIPITDAAGLFPYFRLEIFDLKTGSAVYREQDVLETGQRRAAISPDGDLLAMFDGHTIVIHRLNS